MKLEMNTDTYNYEYNPNIGGRQKKGGWDLLATQFSSRLSERPGIRKEGRKSKNRRPSGPLSLLSYTWV